MADPRDANLGCFNREAAAVHRDRTAVRERLLAPIAGNEAP